MKKLKNILPLFLSLFALFGCKDELIVPIGGGDPQIEILSSPSVAFFADSIAYHVKATDQGVALSTLKVELLYGEEVMSEQILRTKEFGEYKGKLFAPFLKDVPNGTATLRFTLQNVELSKTQVTAPLPLSRPDFPFLNLIVEGKAYKMLRTSENQYQVEDQFPAKVSGFIQAPAFGDSGNIIDFGWVGDKVSQGSTDAIPFSNAFEGVYSITFNTLSYQASPFISYKLNGEEMQMAGDEIYRIDLDVERDQPLQFEGIPGLESWFIDQDFIRVESGNYFFNAENGKYRFTADFKRKYFVIEAMNGNDLASLGADGSGAIWIIGEGIGKPNVTNNEVGWNTGKALCLAPLGGKKYGITVKAGETIKAGSINFKFFHQKNWGGEFKSTDISTTSDVVFIGDGTNGRDSGNLGLIEGKQLESGALYHFIVDVSAGNNKAILTVTKLP